MPPKPSSKPAALAEWRGPTLLLMDGTYFVFRAYHALPPLSTRTGVPTHAAYGFTTMLLKALREVRPSHVAVAFDLGGSDARSAISPEYKANRTAPPDDLIPQFALARRVVRALGIPLLEERGTEADDLIGTLSRVAKAEGFFTVLLAGDKDFMQIVDPRTLLLDTMYDRWVGPEEVEAKTGVRPDQIVEYMALLGDPIDNIPGIPGVGPKTASQLVQQFGTAAAMLDRLGEVPKEKLREKLREHAEGIRLARKLVELNLDVRLPVTLSDLVRKEPPPAPLRSLFEELEFTRLVRELPAPRQQGSLALDGSAGSGSADLPGGPGLHAGVSSPGSPQSTPAEALPAREKQPLSFSTPEVVSSAEAARGALAWLRGHRRIAVHGEIAGAGERPGELVGLALAARGEASRGFYLPLAHNGLGGRIAAEATADLAALLADAGIEKVGFGLKRVATLLRGLGMPVEGLAFDSELALYLIDPGRREHALLDIVPQRFAASLPKLEILELTRRKVSLAELAPDAVAPRAAASAEADLALAPLLEEELRQLGLLELFTGLEMPLLPILAEMEWAGVRVDLDALASLSREVTTQIQTLERTIYDLAGAEFNVASNRQLAEVLFQKLELPIQRRTKTGPSTDQDVLEKLAREHPLPAAVLELRQLSKIKGTYLDALPVLIDPRDGRVHTTFNQATAATGRLSSSDPNLQNIPTRTELGKRIRQAFTASPNSLLISADYNQVELRILAHMSDDPVLKDAFAREVDIHTQTAAEVFGVSISEVVPAMRNAAKAINFGIAYGLSAFGLSQRLELPTREAQEIINKYFERYRGVREWLDGTIEAARRDGAVATLFGRRRLLPDIRSRNAAVRQGAERMAVNTPIQGTAADLIKRAMLRAAKALGEQRLQARMTLQVHDELVFEAPEGEGEAVAALAKEAMSGAGKLNVPLIVTVGIDRNWAAAH